MSVRSRTADRPSGACLPMPAPADAARVSLAEWREYRQRRARHRAQSPAYEAGWHRPLATTAEAVWQLLAPWLVMQPEDLSARFPRLARLTPEEHAERVLVSKQALTVVLDVFVRAARQRRSLTFNHVFDALAARWSDHFRQTREEGRAFQVRDMREETAKAARRDLVRNDIRLKSLWRVAVGLGSGQDGRNPLYRVKRLDYGGYQVFLKDTPARHQFERLLRDDPSYRPDTPGLRVLLADDPLPEHQPRREICAERACNVVALGPRARRLLDLQEQTRLLFDTEAFRKDYKALQRKATKIRERVRAEYGFDPEEESNWTPPTGRIGGRSFVSKREAALRRVPVGRRRQAEADCERYDRRRDATAAFSGVYAEVDRLEPTDAAGHVEIKSGFEVLMNRRYEPTNFWPTFVSGRPDLKGDPVLERLNVRVPVIKSSQRARWFRFPVYAHAIADRTYAYSDEWPLGLEGVDVSSSQTQILAVLLGVEGLEDLATGRSFKQYLAALAWRKHCDPDDPFSLKPGYQDATDERLVKLVKDLWMRCLYGSTARQVVRDRSRKPLKYGPGWTLENALLFLGAIPWYPEVERFLDACRQISRIVDEFEGAVFIDPLDGVQVRWNPVARADDSIASEGQHLLLSLPGRKRCGTFQPTVANEAGDYPVNRNKLRRMIAPCLVHMLDAYFSSLVMERLAKAGVPHFVGVHDCWYVPAYLPSVEPADASPALGAKVLEEARRGASEEWLTGLAPVYDRLLHYLGADPTYGPFVRDIKAKWEARFRERRWPLFAAAESELVKDVRQDE